MLGIIQKQKKNLKMLTDLSDKELLTTYENSDIVTHKYHFDRDKYLSIDDKIKLLDLEAIRAELLEFNRNFWTTGTEEGITKAINDALAWHKLQSLIRTQMLYYDEVINLIRILELSNDEIWKRKEKLGQLYMYTQIKLGGEMNIQSLAELEEEPKQPWYRFYKEEKKIEKIPNSTQILEIKNALKEVPQIKKKVCEYIRNQNQQFRAIEDILEKFRAIELERDLSEEEISRIIDVEDEKSSKTESIKNYLSRTLNLKTQFEEVNLKTEEFKDEEEEDEEEDEEEEDGQDGQDRQEYLGQEQYGLDNLGQDTPYEILHDWFWGWWGYPPTYTVPGLT